MGKKDEGRETIVRSREEHRWLSNRCDDRQEILMRRFGLGMGLKCIKSGRGHQVLAGKMLSGSGRHRSAGMLGACRADSRSRN